MSKSELKPVQATYTIEYYEEEFLQQGWANKKAQPTQDNFLDWVYKQANEDFNHNLWPLDFDVTEIED